MTDFDETAYKDNLSQLLGVDAANISIAVYAASIRVVATVNAASDAAAAALSTQLTALDAAAISTVLGVTVESVMVPRLIQNVISAPLPPAAPPSPSSPPAPLSPAPSPPPPAPDTCFTVEVQTDAYPEETMWSVTDASSGVVLSSKTAGSYITSNELTYEEFCLPEGEYMFNITDTYGDGMTTEPKGAPLAASSLASARPF